MSGLANAIVCPMISFIVPTLNEEKHIEETLKNLSAYRGAHEIVISDGGSTDRTIEIAKRYTAKIVQHTGKERQTIAGGRNEGAFAASGDFIVEIDADTRFHEIDSFFETMLGTFASNPKIVGATCWFRVYPEEETFFDKLIFGITGTMSLILDNILRQGCASGGEFQMMRADAFRKIGGYNKDIVAMEDVEMFSRLRKLGRVHFETKLHIFHSGRRAHVVGWPKMIGTFFVNSVYLLLFNKVRSKTWKVVR